MRRWCCWTRGCCWRGLTCVPPRRLCADGRTPLRSCDLRPTAAGSWCVGDATHPGLQALVRWDPGGLARREIEERQSAHLPPASRVATVIGEPADLEQALASLQLPPGAEVLGPVPVEWGRENARRRVGPLRRTGAARLGRRAVRSARRDAGPPLDPQAPARPRRGGPGRARPIRTPVVEEGASASVSKTTSRLGGVRRQGHPGPEGTRPGQLRQPLEAEPVGKHSPTAPSNHGVDEQPVLVHQSCGDEGVCASVMLSVTRCPARPLIPATSSTGPGQDGSGPSQGRSGWRTRLHLPRVEVVGDPGRVVGLLRPVAADGLEGSPAHHNASAVASWPTRLLEQVRAPRQPASSGSNQSPSISIEPSTVMFSVIASVRIAVLVSVGVLAVSKYRPSPRPRLIGPHADCARPAS